MERMVEVIIYMPATLVWPALYISYIKMLIASSRKWSPSSLMAFSFVTLMATSTFFHVPATMYCRRNATVAMHIGFALWIHWWCCLNHTPTTNTAFYQHSCKFKMYPYSGFKLVFFQLFFWTDAKCCTINVPHMFLFQADYHLELLLTLKFPVPHLWNQVARHTIYKCQIPFLVHSQ